MRIVTLEQGASRCAPRTRKQKNWINFGISKMRVFELKSNDNPKRI